MKQRKIGKIIAAWFLCLAMVFTTVNLPAFVTEAEAETVQEPKVESLKLLKTEDGEFYIEATVLNEGTATYDSLIYLNGQLIGEKIVKLNETSDNKHVINITDNDLDKAYIFDEKQEYFYVLKVNDGSSTYTCNSEIIDRDIPINEYFFPDAELRQYLANYQDSNSDGVLSKAERERITKIERTYTDPENPLFALYYYHHIDNLEGLQYLPNLEELVLSGKFEYFDPSPFQNLLRLDLTCSDIRNIDLSHNQKLKSITFQRGYSSDEGYLEVLDLSKNPNLTTVAVLHQENLNVIDFGVKENLEKVWIGCCGTNLVVNLSQTNLFQENLSRDEKRHLYLNIGLDFNNSDIERRPTLYFTQKQNFYFEDAKYFDEAHTEENTNFAKINNVKDIKWYVGYVTPDCGNEGFDFKGHHMVMYPAIENTCSADGISKEYGVCVSCGRYFVRLDGDFASKSAMLKNSGYALAATGNHNLEKIEQADATCLTSGTKPYYRCKDCHRLFTDAEGTTRIENLEVWKQGPGFIDGVGAHDMIHCPEKSANCVEAGYKEYYHCEFCNRDYETIDGQRRIMDVEAWRLGDGKLAPLGHNCTNATCHTQGICTKCGKEVYDLTKHEQLDEFFYHDDNQHWKKCKYCGEKVDVVSHNYEYVDVVYPTCTTPGTMQHYRCECGACSYNGEVTGIIEDFEEWKNDEAKGKIAPSGHPMSMMEYDTNGHWDGCSRCGERIEGTFMPHTLIDDVDGQVCSYCGYRSSSQSHTHMTMGGIHYEIPATCESDGVKAYYECDICRHYFEDGSDLDDLKNEIEDLTAWKTTGNGVIKAAGHVGGVSTCQRLAICTVCNREYGSLKTHEYEDILHADKDHHWLQCKYCTQTKEVNDHTAGPEATDLAAQICLECGYVLKPRLSHTHVLTKMEDGLKCEEDGYEVYYQCVCGLQFKDANAQEVITDFENWKVGAGKVSALGHTGGTATCSTLAKCDRCGNEYGNLAAHDYNATWNTTRTNHWKVCNTCDGIGEYAAHVPGAEATETTDQVCIACNMIITPKLSHEHATIKVNGTIATCQVEGTKNYYKCECGFLFEDAEATKVIEDIEAWKANAGKLAKLSHSGTVATCQHKAVCSMCGDEFGELAEHTWNTGEVTKEPTLEEEGIKTYTCTVCSDTKTEPIDKLTQEQPSEAPSGNPSVAPSGNPSEVPSGNPSVVPSGNPSEVPSGKPSVAPSGNPSVAPSGNPSEVPSGKPSVAPSGKPSVTPSKAPVLVKQTITVTKKARKTVKFKAASLEKKKATLKLKAKANTKLTYKVSKYPKKAKKYISVTKKGVITMKKGAKKGTYKVVITAKADSKYEKATKTITIKVR